METNYKQDDKNKFLKVGVVLWTIDPNNTPRFLLRHAKPFGGYDDEWTIVFGNVEKNETAEEAAKREAFEEFGINQIENVLNLSYEIEFKGKHGLSVIHFFALRVPNIDVKISLNEESIGCDWMIIDKVKQVMQYDDEKHAFDIILSKL